MALETGTYISDLVATNPIAADPKSAGDDHIRLLKSTIKATFPNVTGAVTPTHTELNYVDGVTSAIQTQLDLKAPLASPILTGVPEAPTAALGTSNTQIATTAFVAATSLTASLPGQTGKNGQFLKTDGSTADWSNAIDLTVMLPVSGTKIATTTGTETLTDKTVTDLIIANDADQTKRANFVLSGVTAGQNRNITLEDRDTLLMTPGWVYLSTVTASISATVDIETTIDSTYKTYVIVFENVAMVNTAVSLYCRLKIAGSYHSGASDYNWSYFTLEGSTLAGNSDIADSKILLTNDIENDTQHAISGKIILHNPSSTSTKKRIQWELLDWRDSISMHRMTVGHATDSSSNSAVTGVRFIGSSGNISTGTFTLFGIRGA